MARSSLNGPISLPLNDDNLSEGTNGAVDGVSKAALTRGFTLEPEAEGAMDPMGLMFGAPGGFLGRGRGWER